MKGEYLSGGTLIIFSLCVAAAIAQDGQVSITKPQNWNALFRAYLPKSVSSIVKYRNDFVANHKVKSVGGK